MALVFPTGGYYPPDIVKAFEAFCEGHLITIVKKADMHEMQLGKDIGLLSYIDTPMKEIIQQGITVISTDFKDMGNLAARFILTREPVRQVVKTKIILRNSL